MEIKTRKFSELSIKVIYVIDLFDVEIPEDIAIQMENACIFNKSIGLNYEEDTAELRDWLIDNINEDNCDYIRYKIDNFEE